MAVTWVEIGPCRLACADCLEVLPTLPAGSADAVVTDPPAGIGFMSKTWDDPGSYGFTDGGNRHGTPPTMNLARNPTCRSCGGRMRAGPMTKPCSCAAPAFNTVQLVQRDRSAFIAFLRTVLAECLRIAKPGAVMLCWAIPRTSHWTATACEDAGWVIEDRIAHLFGTGFPKHTSKLKPACEDWWLCRKPGPKWLGVEACRIPAGERPLIESVPKNGNYVGVFREGSTHAGTTTAGRWPANVVLDEDAAAALDLQAGERPACPHGPGVQAKGMFGVEAGHPGFNDSGGASRFFYCAKADRADRGRGNGHPTVKSTALMRWLVRLACPEGGTVLDPFAGSFSTGKAAVAEGCRFVGVEREAEYFAAGCRRIEAAVKDQRDSLFPAAAAPAVPTPDLFGDAP